MLHRIKPRILQDIYRQERIHPFQSITVRLNLRHSSEFRIPIRKIARAVVVVWASWIFVLGAVAAPTTQIHAVAATSNEERARLEEELRVLEQQIDEYENQIIGYQKQGKSLGGEVQTLNSKISKLNLQIKAIDLTLGELNNKISETQDRIQDTENSIERNRVTLGALLKNLYVADQASMMEMFLANPKISDFFGDLNSIMLLESNIHGTISQIRDLQTELVGQKEQYALARADASTIRSYQAVQRTEIDAVKKDKSTLLAITKGQEVKYQSLLKKTEATAAEIRSRIFQLLGGGEMSFEDAYQFAKFASQATGVRPALILAVLDRESALGKNVGRCSYETSMSPKNQAIFLEITKELGISPESAVVSCANADGVYGGAMGPSQFIPSTWMMYKDEVASVTGHNPPSPWNNADAFVATGLYLQDAGAAGASITDERKAAARYYAGGNWSRFLWSYGEAVITRAQRFEEDIKTITGT